MGSIKDFFTLKTSSQIYREERTKKIAAMELSKPTGIMAEIAGRERDLQNYKDAVESFLNDISLHFGDAAVFLTEKYISRTKSSNLHDIGFEKQFAIKWCKNIYDKTVTSDFYFTKTNETDGHRYLDSKAAATLSVELSFMYTFHHENGVRIDYIMDITDGVARAAINENFIPESTRTGESALKELTEIHDKRQSIRRFSSHESFIKNGKVPDWFIDALHEHAIVAGSGMSINASVRT